MRSIGESIWSRWVSTHVIREPTTPATTSLMPRLTVSSRGLPTSSPRRAATMMPSTTPTATMIPKVRSVTGPSSMVGKVVYGMAASTAGTGA
jgi:hypothetical protein